MVPGSDREEVVAGGAECISTQPLPDGRGSVLTSPGDTAQGRISIVIPTLNEAEHLRGTLDGLRQADVYEIIVADGGSGDETADIALACGATVVRCERGRGMQFNAGAAAAGGEILLFLHADTSLPAGFEACVREMLERPGVSAGAFSLRIDGARRSYRVIERLVAWRSRFLGLPYGDQALFMTDETFQAVGRYPEFAAMEDFELVRRLRRIGQIAIAIEQVVTSARRWSKRGVLRTTALNAACVAAYLCGVSPHRIASWRSD
ncbi:MAG: TIGR04283 family arsenosugar biosynthesis glycosyltransferase [Planctomycetes bacterium]|nr:TIGR04283 family arsenosugar biosynthesis glycosyltransferase [Planctomycetota bacterium]